VSTFPGTQNLLGVEQARLRSLVAWRRDGRFSDWSPIKTTYRYTKSHLLIFTRKTGPWTA